MNYESSITTTTLSLVKIFSYEFVSFFFLYYYIQSDVLIYTNFFYV